MSALSTAQPLASQVGGHAGVLTTEDGSLIIKPALPLELQFYQSLTTDTGFAALRPFIPKFLGTLKVEGQVDPTADQAAQIVVAPVADQKDECFQGASRVSLVLENLSFPFLKPNILDVKLGTVLYDETASPDKVVRMIKAARDTTSFETGVRLTGFQVYDNVTAQPINTPKSYGKSIKASDLPDGIARFFPVASSIANPSATANTGLPRTTLLPILHALRADIADIRAALAAIHMRMVGGSLLIIYEADLARAEEGVRRLGVDDGDENGDEDDDDDEDEDDDGKPGPPYVVKLIDFAHTRITPGAGPDEGVLTGVDTMLRLIDGRIQELE